MAAISGFSSTVQSERLTGLSRVERTVKLDFGDGVDTYPTGGIPVSKGDLGCPNVIEGLSFMDSGSGDGYVYKYDQANEKVLAYVSEETGTPGEYELVELANTVAIQGSLVVIVNGF